MKSGGIGKKLMYALYSSGYKGNFSIKAVDSEFVKASDVDSQLVKYGLDRNSIINKVKNENQT